MKKAFGIGFERYKEFFDKSRYYVDKTGLIPELLERGTTVNLFTRPVFLEKRWPLACCGHFSNWSSIPKDRK